MIKKTTLFMGFLMLLAGCTFNGRKDIQVVPTQGTADDSSLAQVCGTVTYRERMALPQDAVIHLTLSDVSRQQRLDSPSKLSQIGWNHR